MRMQLYKSGRDNRGSALVFTVLLMGLVAILVSTYMSLVQNQSRSTMRSQAWNSAVPLIEAGIEEALAHLNHNGVANLGRDGWELVDGLYCKQRTMGDGFYVVGISNAGAQAMIRSQGYVGLPGVASATPEVFLAATSTPLANTHLGRGVEVLARSDNLFTKGLVAKGQINMNGNNISTDSFDSLDSNHSTGGLYDVSKRKDNGDVATNSDLVNSVNVGNADIYGRVSTGPGGTIAVGANGGVGSAAWHAGGTPGIEPGYSADDMNVNFPDVDPPFATGDPVSGGNYDGNNYDYLLGTGNYYLDSNLAMSGGGDMIVTGNAVLYVTGNVSMSGQAVIKVAPGGSLSLYVGGSSASFGGNGVVNNAGNATNFIYYGLPSNTSLSVQGNGAFTGIIYAPSAALSLNGGGSSPDDLIGASITSTVTMNGHFKFHYDEALQNFGASRGYVVTSWAELQPGHLATLEALVDGGVLYTGF